jgi:N-acetyl-gamma-glutamyl-phosphate reductase
VRVLAKGKLPDTKNVSFTNVCEIGFAFDEHTGRLLVFSVIDNLTKALPGRPSNA